ncbi:MAG: CIA30 family protein [Planctomycetes bacterium]|nr:CIA30 family protein [Planctomycetota bacterium]
MLVHLLTIALQVEMPTLVLRNGRVFDPVALELRAPADLWIGGERVIGERPLGAALPSDAAHVEVRDVGGATLLPGLFDLHVHVAVAGTGMDAFVALEREEHLRSQLACGITHVVDLHDDATAVFAARERSLREPDLARLHAAGSAFTAPGGHGTQFGIEENVVTTPAEVDARFAKLLELRPDVIKLILEHGEWGPVPKLPTLDGELAGAIARRAHEARLPLFAHVWTLDEARTAVERGADVLAHGVFVGAIDEPLVAALKERNVAYVPTLAVVVGSRRAASERTPYARELARSVLHPDVYASVASGHGSGWSSRADFGGGEAQWFANLKKLADAGVTIGAGTDAGNPLTPHGPALLEELALYVEAGLSPARALRAATLDAAKILRVERDFGALEPGRVADVVVLRGDPLRSIDELWNVVDVFKAGRRVDREALARRIAERAAPKAKRSVGKDVPARLDDFDDGDLTSACGTSWLGAEDSALGGKSNVTISVQDGVLRAEGELRAGFPYGPFAGAALRFDADERRVLDATNFDGLRLRVRGTERSWSFTLNRAAVKDFNVFATELELGPEWREVEIPFKTLQQVGFGEPVPWAPDDFTGLELDARAPWGSNEVGSFWFELDWIEFARRR